MEFYLQEKPTSLHSTVDKNWSCPAHHDREISCEGEGREGGIMREGEKKGEGRRERGGGRAKRGKRGR